MMMGLAWVDNAAICFINSVFCRSRRSIVYLHLYRLPWEEKSTAERELTLPQINEKNGSMQNRSMPSPNSTVGDATMNVV